MTDRILLFIPMYRCERQIARVIGRITPAIATRFTEVVVVDNGSPDGSVAAAQAALGQLGIAARILVNVENFNLGGSHKVAFDWALAGGFTHVVVLHGDDQADIADLMPVLDAGLHRSHDCLLGSRFGRGSRLVGYSRFRIFGNHVFNLVFSVATGRWLTDLGSGLNIFATGMLTDRFYRALNDDLTFNNQLLLSLVHRRVNYAFFPISWREEDQVSNVRLFRQAWKTLSIATGYALRRGGYLARYRGRHGPEAYVATTVYEHRPAASGAPA